MVYYPKGVCSKRFDISLQNGIIQEVKITGGCDGNLKAICAFLKGRRPEEIIPLFKGSAVKNARPPAPTSWPRPSPRRLRRILSAPFPPSSLPPFPGNKKGRPQWGRLFLFIPYSRQGQVVARTVRLGSDSIPSDTAVTRKKRVVPEVMPYRAAEYSPS